MNADCINGIACNRIETGAGRKEKDLRKRYGTIPLAWLKNLPGNSGKVKLVAILWFLNAVKGGGWFSIGQKLRKEYGISPSQQNKILMSLEKSEHVKLRHSPGKAVQIRLIKPEGWG